MWKIIIHYLSLEFKYDVLISRLSSFVIIPGFSLQSSHNSRKSELSNRN